jgi:SAM-dependent methyltransferase
MEGIKRWTRRARASLIAFLARNKPLVRDPLALIYIRGDGVEYGALNWVQRVGKGVRVRYADIAQVDKLEKNYPQHAGRIAVPQIVCSLESLDPFGSESLDFFIANHVLEHVEDPIQAFKSIYRVLKPGAIFFLTLPDKRYTFDIDREITPWEHLVRDHEQGPEWSRRDHYADAAINIFKIPKAELEQWVEQKMSERADIHFHVWDQAAMIEMLNSLRREYCIRFDIEALSKTGLETIFVLRKTSSS